MVRTAFLIRYSLTFFVFLSLCFYLIWRKNFIFLWLILVVFAIFYKWVHLLFVQLFAFFFKCVHIIFVRLWALFMLFIHSIFFLIGEESIFIRYLARRSRFIRWPIKIVLFVVTSCEKYVLREIIKPSTTNPGWI